MILTIKDVAKSAKVSTATVDRVLNGRQGVREATRRRVLETAAVMGYTHVAAQMAGLDFLLPTRPAVFMEQMAVLLRKASAEAASPNETDAASVRIHHIDYDKPEQVARLLAKIRTETSGIGIVTLDHILIRDALKSAIEHGVPVVTMLSDISSLPHQGYIGVDNRLAGRLVGYLIGRLATGGGQVAIFTGSQGYRGHEEREMGFRHILRTEYPHLHVLPTLETGEDPETGYRVMTEMLASNPDLRAVYNIGAGSEGIARAIEDCTTGAQPTFVAHELSAETKPYLLSGVIDAVVDENLPALADRAVTRLATAARHRMLGICTPQDARVIMRENIPVDWF
ncbi:LacI family DNA-binding transcriptional regulator [Sphingomonas sp. 1P08PE]|uniref:LacI family DNA-binding transcriptional regulator n=1 Tax=Sphingomonas sp. 1P08PE TaxID=554122 RepID=UPI0039A37BEE